LCFGWNSSNQENVASRKITSVKKRQFYLVDPVIFRSVAGNPESQWPVSFLGAFAKCLSVRPIETTRIPLDGFYEILYLNICQKKNLSKLFYYITQLHTIHFLAQEKHPQKKVFSFPEVKNTIPYCRKE